MKVLRRKTLIATTNLNMRNINMTSSEIILEIIAYAKEQGVDFETALRMFQMMYEDKAYLYD